MDYLSFKKWADTNYSALKLPADCRELLSPTTVPASSLVWAFKWYLQFGDDKYVRVWEFYDRVGHMMGMSKRVQFAYHYGDLVRLGPDGVPKHEPSDPLDLRIDNVSGPAHLHFGAQNPHHQQAVVKGLQLDGLDMFDFVKGIIRHRAIGQPLDKVFGFRIE